VKVEYVPLNQLIPYVNNPKKHPPEQVKKIASSIKEFGFRVPIVVDKDFVIIAGHGRYEAAKLLGLKEVPVIIADDLTPAQAKAFRIADNKVAESDWDLEALAAELAQLKEIDYDLELTGFDDEEVSELIRELEVVEEEEVGDEEEEDELPEVDEEVEPFSKRGDIWLLGRHRVMCGDSTSRADVERLMDGKKADSLITDPPYGVDYNSKNEFLNKYNKGNLVQRPILNDNIQDYRKFFRTWLANAREVLAEYNTVYIFMLGKELINLRLAFEEVGGHWSDYLVWVKNNHVLSRKDYMTKHEFILYGWFGKHKFYAPFQRTTVLEYAKPQRSDLHPTMKPIPLLEQLITDGSPKGGVILDLFGGSGSTLIAAEKTGRTCYMMELDPHYVDVIVWRYLHITGKDDITLIRGGEELPFSEIKSKFMARWGVV